MAAAEVKAPALREFGEIPALAAGAMGNTKPYIANDKIQQAIGFPGELRQDWKEHALGKMGELLGKYRSLQVFMDACVHCGACTDKCHYFLGTGDPLNMPVARQELMRGVYRRYFTLAGRLFPRLVGARELTRELIDQWYSYYHQCSECRRCSVFCPYGIDTAEVTMAGREILDSIGIGQKYSNEIIGKVHRIGNNLGLPGPALADTLLGLEEDVKEETGVDVRYPLDEAGAEVLLVTPSADFFAEPHVESLIGYGKVFHAAGIRWTLSSKASEAGNFGMFIGNFEQLRLIALRIREAALEHFARDGYDRATIRAIAKTAGVSPGLLRHHYGSKEALRETCDHYVFEMLHRANAQLLDDPGASAQTQQTSKPFGRYVARSLADGSPTVGPIFDEMVTMTEDWLVRADASRTDRPAADRRIRAALVTAMKIGIPLLHEHVSRAIGTEMFEPEGDRLIALALLDIYSHALIDHTTATSAATGYEEPQR